MDVIKDKVERIIDYLRISITDHCNLRCIFCMPADGMKPMEIKNSLTSEEIVRIVRTAAGLGVKKIRLTGGEPLTRKDLPSVIESIRHVEGIEDISLTTNGQLLENSVHTLLIVVLAIVMIFFGAKIPQMMEGMGKGIRSFKRGVSEKEEINITLPRPLKET